MLEPYEYIKAEPAKEDGMDGETDLDGSDGLCLGVGMDLVDIGLEVEIEVLYYLGCWAGSG